MPSQEVSPEKQADKRERLGLFVQDTWKATGRLTLTYGVRWEINTPPVSTTPGKPLYAVGGIFNPGPLALKDAPLWSTRFRYFAPRVGGAWWLTPNVVVRSGIGLFYDLGYGSQGWSSTYPYNRRGIFAAAPGTMFDPNDPAFNPLPFTTAIPRGEVLNAVDPNLGLPMISQWNVAIERKFGANQSLVATYAGSWGSNLIASDFVFPNDTNLARVTHNWGISHNNLLQVQFHRRMTRGFQALASYALARSTDSGSSDVGQGSSASYVVNVADSVDNLRRLPSAPSDFDVRHSFSAAVSWESPQPKPGTSAPIVALVKGWALDGLLRAHTARPLNVWFQRLVPSGFYYNVQADVVPGQPFWLPDSNAPRGLVLNADAFAEPAGETGNFPRNSLRTFPFAQLDVALRRRFQVTERVKLDARAEFFNVFNHPMFQDPNTLWGVGSVRTPFFGNVQSTLNQGLGGGGLSGGQAEIYAPGGPRSAQLSLRLIF